MNDKEKLKLILSMLRYQSETWHARESRGAREILFALAEQEDEKKESMIEYFPY